MISVAELVNDPDLGAQSISVARYQNTGGFAQGGYTLGAPKILTIWAAVQPATPKDLQQVPEGDRVRGGISIWSQTPLFTTTASGTPDIVTWHGDQYRVQDVLDWADGSFQRYLGLRVIGD